MSDFIKEIKFESVYDTTNADGKNYGIHRVELKFILKNIQGAVVFVVYTNWYLPHIKVGMKECYPADLGYHSPIPHYEGQSKITDDCHIIGGDCYYDGSGLNAQRPWNILIEKGSDGVWEFLEKYHSYIFNGTDYPSE